MKVPVKIYREVNGQLELFNSGDCLVYSLKLKNETKHTKQYVSFNFGEFRIHIELNKFKELYYNIIEYNTDGEYHALVSRHII